VRKFVPRSNNLHEMFDGKSCQIEHFSALRVHAKMQATVLVDHLKGFPPFILAMTSRLVKLIGS